MAGAKIRLADQVAPTPYSKLIGTWTGNATRNFKLARLNEVHGRYSPYAQVPDLVWAAGVDAGDGASAKLLSSYYGTDAAAQAAFPTVASVTLADELGGVCIQAALNAAITTGVRGGLDLGPGYWRTTRSLSLSGVAGLRVFGSRRASGAGTGTTVRWVGNGTAPVWLLQDCRDLVFEDFNVLANSSTPMDTGFKIENITGSTQTPTRNNWYRVIVNGTSAGGLTRAGWHHAQGTGGDSNNDFGFWERCSVINYDACGWLWTHAQSRSHHWVGCLATAATGNTAAIGCSAGKDVKAATVSNAGGGLWEGGSLNNNKDCDFYVSPSAANFVIIGSDGEDSKCFLRGHGTTSSPTNITVTGARWNHAGSLAADGFVIDKKNPGSLTLIGCAFQDHAPYDAGNPMAIRYYGASATNVGSLVVIGGTFGSKAATAEAAFVRNGTTDVTRLSLLGVMLKDEETGVYTPLTSQLV